MFKFLLFIEEGEKESEYLELAVPMVCFCDIPLSKVKNHIETYGKVGIGLSKEWGIAKNISPLIYVNTESETTKAIRISAQNLIKSENFYSDSSENDFFLRLLRLIRFTKPYQGRFYRKGEYIETVRFYDEREWRFIPDISVSPVDKEVANEQLNQNVLQIKPWITREDYLDKIKINFYHEELKNNHSLTFSPKDVKYIILESEDQVDSFINILKSVYSASEIPRLTSKIITHDQIINDF